MLTSDLKRTLKRKLKRPISIDELNAIAVEMGKQRPPQSRTSGGTSYQWNTEDIEIVINKLTNN